MELALEIKQYVAIVRSGHGSRFSVFETGDPKFYCFVPMVGESSIMGTLQFPVKKSDLRDDICKMLRHGCGNSL
jgi:hypothetical protein